MLWCQSRYSRRREFGQRLGVQVGFNHTPEVGSEEDTEAPLMEDDIVQSVQGTDGEEADTEQDCGTGLEDSVPRISLRDGLGHAKGFQAALEQHEAFGEEEYSPVQMIVNKIHAHLACHSEEDIRLFKRSSESM